MLDTEALSTSSTATRHNDDNATGSVGANGAEHIRWDTGSGEAAARTKGRAQAAGQTQPYESPYQTTRRPSEFDIPVYASTIDWDQPIDECDFLYRKQLSQLRKRKTGITRLSIFDFDNTLFKSPLPNPQLWDQKLIGMLKSTDLGWFQDSRTLSAPYLQYTDDHWMKPVEQLAHEEYARSDTLVVLLTGRSHSAYRKLVLGLIEHRKGLKFDIVILKETPTRESPLVSQVDFNAIINKPAAPLTFDYKMTVVEDAVSAFPGIQEIAMWDDRTYQCEKMQHYLDALQRRNAERITKAVVYHVPPQTIYMSRDNERALINDMVREYNDRVMANLPEGASKDGMPVVGSLQMREYASYTGVFLDHRSRQLLLRNIRCPHGWTRAANHMTLALGPADAEYLDKSVGAQPGARVELVADSIGTLAGAVIAVGVSKIKTRTGTRTPITESAPHITIAYNEPAGYRPAFATNIKWWKPLRPKELVLKGVVAEHMLTTASIVRPEVRADDISIGGLVCQYWPQLKGKDIGMAVSEARQRMTEKGIENSEANRGSITNIIRDLF
ncbi:hypothetical protein GQ54DRAFT_297855 [Martensiomyces pterosporus]|nr:hypothetical protein GQ54DRAFT_297855 [Martensiomyces pterosporus]